MLQEMVLLHVHRVILYVTRRGSVTYLDAALRNYFIYIFRFFIDKFINVYFYLQDVERLCGELPNLATRYLVPFEQFNHLDFVYATDVVPLVYSEVMALMTKYR